jgi:hypothetical protein
MQAAEGLVPFERDLDRGARRRFGFYLFTVTPMLPPHEIGGVARHVLGGDRRNPARRGRRSRRIIRPLQRGAGR